MPLPPRLTDRRWVRAAQASLGSSADDTLHARLVAAAASRHLDQVPHPAKCYVPTASIGACLKYARGDSAPPAPGCARASDEAALSRRLGDCVLLSVVEDTNSLFSAAALALFGSEDLYLVPRLQAAAEAARHPERCTPA